MKNMNTETLPISVSPATKAGDIISKRNYLEGLQCTKKVYLSKHRKDLAKPVSNQQIEEGHRFEKQARELVAPGGIEVRIDPANLDAAVERTRELLTRKTVTIYQAAFKTSSGELSIADAIVKSSAGIRLYEFKAAVNISDVHVYDVTFQVHNVASSGYPLISANLVYINKSYVKNGPLDSNFIVVKNITNVVHRMKRQVPKTVSSLRNVINLPEEPDKEIGIYCMDPHPCPFKDYCWDYLPTNNIFDVKHMKISQKLGLYYKGITGMEDVKIHMGKKLKEGQFIQINAALTNSIAMQKDKLRQWCDNLRGKELFFWDVETILPATPIYNGTKPFQQIVTQYSLHIRGLDKKLTHKEYLAEADASVDFRRELLIKLLVDLEAGKSDSPIIVFNAAFEGGRLRDFARAFPEFKNEIKNVLSRLTDLMLVFKNNWYVDPRFRGSYSIKAILPVLCPDLDYKKLPVSNGSQAIQEFMKLYEMKGSGVSKIRKALKLYCATDTIAMVRILEFLEQL